ncbi:Transmembrane protein 87A [Hondaea fermentalgiana]|uniref:Transmembrane protein 87A n=1 Tax=Hondaea fermentalgiana TaxID=2315210 RepID=A0A2R5G6Y7_9STRA|nr:Transmembrane protein 87A [Hondaea fermentalgiana]|eukprot:GBG26079.1 Transmembrane protein 87A [Hondaea fermentalgiana]
MPRSSYALVMALAMLATSTQQALAAVNTYNAEKLENNFLMFRKNAMYAMSDAPYVIASENARSVIEISLKFNVPPELAADPNTLVQVSAFPAEDYKYLGINVEDAGSSAEGSPGERLYCCSESMAAEGAVCTVPHSLIFSPGAHDVVSWDVMPDGEGEARLFRTYTIEKKGFYYLVINFCNPTSSEIEVTGETRWVNPYGFLPAEVYGFLGFYFYMSIAYVVASMVWTYLCGRHWRELHQLQNCISVVLAFGLLESFLRYYDFYHFNLYGTRSKFFMFTGLFFLCVKKTVSRMLVLVVAMGFGVLRPSLGENANKIAALGGAHFLLSYLHLVITQLNHSRALTFGGFLLEVPVVAVDFIIFMWSFSSLAVIIKSLGARRQETKLDLYVSFRRILVAAVVVGCAWSVFFAYCIRTNYVDLHWQDFYKLEAFWDVLYFAVLLAIIYLWAPSASSQRYAYDKVDGFDPRDEEYATGLEDVKKPNED